MKTTQTRTETTLRSSKGLSHHYSCLAEAQRRWRSGKALWWKSGAPGGLQGWGCWSGETGGSSLETEHPMWCGCGWFDFLGWPQRGSRVRFPVIWPLSVCMFSLWLYLGQPVYILLLRVYKPWISRMRPGRYAPWSGNHCRQAGLAGAVQNPASLGTIWA